MKRTLSILIYILLIFSTAVAELEIHFLNVGQGDAAIVMCDNKVLMIDGGGAEKSSFIYSYLKNTLGLEYIDCIIATHPHEDHVGGIAAALNACSVGSIYSTVSSHDSKAFNDMLKYAREQNIYPVIPSVGDCFALGEATVQFLSPGKEYDETNNTSLVAKITYKDNTFLFCGDVQEEAEAFMIKAQYDLASDVLKVGHHGAEGSSSSDFLEAVSPKYAVISAGKDNSYSHPHATVLERLSEIGATTYRTDTLGTIICKSDGSDIRFITENKQAFSEYKIKYIESTDNSPYIGNKNSKKFHYASCSSVDEMKEKNKVPFANKQIAIDKGYTPCKRCNP